MDELVQYPHPHPTLVILSRTRRISIKKSQHGATLRDQNVKGNEYATFIKHLCVFDKSSAAKTHDQMKKQPKNRETLESDATSCRHISTSQPFPPN